MLQSFGIVQMHITRFGIANFEVLVVVFQQNMQLLSTESGENQQRQKEGNAIKSAMLRAFFQLSVL
jgi:hypothetical protein